jgi:hypothetical protein
MEKGRLPVGDALVVRSAHKSCKAQARSVPVGACYEISA